MVEQSSQSSKGFGRRRIVLGQALVAGLAAVILLAIVFGLGRAASQSGQEMDLKSTGRAWELNEDHNGHLWISDYEAGEIWHLNPATDVYTAYRGLSGASDGRLAADGYLWWSDYDNYEFGRLDLDSNIRTTWPVTEQVAGLNFDDQGRVWMPAWSSDSLYRFDPQTNEFCHYQLPNNSASYYIESHGGYLWLADSKGTYIYRIDPNNGSYTEWHYGRASNARGMTFDDDGNLWWASYKVQVQSRLFQLNPNSTFMTYYNLPDSAAEPVMVDAGPGLIWYSDYTGSFGWLNPQVASGTLEQVTRDARVLAAPDCRQDWQPIGSSSTVHPTESAAWTTGFYTVTNDAPGWQSYQLPEDSVDWGPWGIRARQDGVWVVDQERQKLLHMPRQDLYVPLVVK